MAKSIKELMSKSKRSEIVKKARKGHDFGKPNRGGKHGFKHLVNKLESEGKSLESAKKIAGAQFWKQESK